ncbi:hypothetical protein LCGC14_0437680 [marine sediment metagenome]|uniref:Uncharacterized protein n=1 Tax=marine sediment metagenome TaxID=412755 RepID=A0A0F9T4Q4_9ZZZZ
MPYDKYNSPKKKKSNWVSRLKKSVASLWGPGHSPAGKKYIAKKKQYTSLATKGVERRLKAAGLTDAEIKRLR